MNNIIRNDDLKRNISNLFLASISVHDSRRSDAFGSLYSMMRIVDDLADAMAEGDESSQEELARIRSDIAEWEESVLYCYEGDSQTSGIDLKVMQSIAKFQVPKRIWTWFFNGMRTPVSCRGFSNLEELTSYGRAAATAPLAVFLITLFSEPNEYGLYALDPELRILQVAESLGLWSYMMHLLSLEKKYLLSRDPARNLLPLDIMNRYRIPEEDLLEMAGNGTSDKPMRDMVRELMGWAAGTGSFGLGFVKEYVMKLPEDRRNALAIYVTIYSAISRRIRAREFDIFADPPIWSPEDRTKVASIIQGADNFEEIVATW